METDPDSETIVTDGNEVGPLSSAQGPVAGERLGRYILLDQIGQGGMGAVFLAHDPDLDRQVALKVLRTGNRDESASARLVREAQSLARLEHPCVVSVFEVGHEGPRTFIAMQYVPGQTLRWHAGSGPCPSSGGPRWRPCSSSCDPHVVGLGPWASGRSRCPWPQRASGSARAPR